MTKPFLLNIQLFAPEGSDRLHHDITSQVDAAFKDQGESQIKIDINKSSLAEDAYEVELGFDSEAARAGFEERILPELNQKYKILLVNQSVSDTTAAPPPTEPPSTVNQPAASEGAATEHAIPFASFEELLASHAELLIDEIHKKDSIAPDVLENIAEFIRRGTATGARLDNPEQRRTAQSLLNYWVTILYRAGQPSPPEPILAYYSQPIKSAFASDACPYIGLRAFQEEDKNRFFGRDELIKSVVDRLKEKPLVVLIGPPGSGKTSLLNAGVIPRLKTDVTTQNWTFFPLMTPGADPLNRLGSLFSDQPDQVAQKLLDHPNHLLELINDSNWGETPRVLVIDQFEELFTFCRDDQQREAFLKSLFSLKESSISHRVVLSLRSDHLNQMIRRPHLNDIFRDADIRVYPPSETDLHKIIEKPAEQIGLKFQAGVPDQIIREIYGDPGGLPLLQFGLLELWNDREGATITWAAMNRLRSCHQALVDKAEAFYELLTPEEKEEARRLLLRMVKLSDTWEAATEPVRRGDLYQGENNQDRVNAILDKLLRANLARISNADGSSAFDTESQQVITAEGLPDDQVELAHGTLARAWPRMSEWLRKQREGMVTRQRLELFAANWAILGRSEKGLLDKYQLHEAQQWLTSETATELGYDPDLEALISRSEKSIQSAKRLQRALVTTSVTLLIFALVVLGLVFKYTRESLKTATSTRLAIQARENLASQLDLALLLSLEAHRKDNDNMEARNSLMKAFTQSPKLEAYLHNNRGKIKQNVFGPSGERLYVRSANGSVRMWDMASRHEVSEFKPSNQTDLLQTNSTNCSRLSRDGRWLVTIEDQGAVVMRRLDDPRDTRKLENAKLACFESFQFLVSDDNKKVAWLTLVPESSGNEAKLSVWDVDTNEPLTKQENYAFGTMAFCPDNKTLAIASLNNDILLLQSDNLTPIGKPLRSAAANLSIGSLPMQFSKDGTRLASVKPNGDLAVWDLRTQKEIANIKFEVFGDKPSPRLEDLAKVRYALNEAGDKLVTGSSRGILFFNVKSNTHYLYPARPDSGTISSIAFSPDGTRVLTLRDNEQPVLWQGQFSESEGVIFGEAGSRIPLPSGRTATISSITFSPDSNRVAGACDDGTIVLWNLEQKLEGKSLGAEGVKDFQILNDGKILIRKLNDEVIWFDPNTGATTGQFPLGSNAALRLKDTFFSNNGAVLVASYLNNRVVVWNPKNGSQTFVIAEGEPSDSPEQSTTTIEIGMDYDGKQLAVANNKQQGTEIQLWSLTDRTKHVLTETNDRVVDLTFSRDSKLLAVSDEAGKTTVWDVNNRSLLNTLSDEGVSRNDNVEFNVDGTKLITLSADRTLRLWDLTESSLLSKSATRMSDFALSPDSHSLSIAGINDDESIVFWDVDNSREQFAFGAEDVAALGGGTSLTTIAYTPDGKTLIAGYTNGTASSLHVDLPSWSHRGCRIANRILNLPEWLSHKVFEDMAGRFIREAKSLYKAEEQLCARPPK